ncbi:hypothetical protein J6590_075126, partial [Homalodisca vitripennis]
ATIVMGLIFPLLPCTSSAASANQSAYVVFSIPTTNYDLHSQPPRHWGGLLTCSSAYRDLSISLKILDRLSPRDDKQRDKRSDCP